jgi:hypothetical protein
MARFTVDGVDLLLPFTMTSSTPEELVVVVLNSVKMDGDEWDRPNGLVVLCKVESNIAVWLLRGTLEEDV